MKSCSVLVVDDEADLRDIVSRVLIDAGHRVTCAANGQEASRALSQQDFDVILTDVIMPEKDGMQVIVEARRTRPTMRIVAMSGGGHVGREQYLKMAKSLGAHAVLEKPFNGDELVAAITAVMAGARA
jgi:DNA-binding response OmpR family regulator